METEAELEEETVIDLVFNTNRHDVLFTTHSDVTASIKAVNENDTSFVVLLHHLYCIVLVISKALARCHCVKHNFFCTFGLSLIVLVLFFIV